MHVNRRLSDLHIRSTCRELLTAHGSVSGRQLRRELKARFGASCKTARVFQIWREETGHAAMPPPAVREMQQRMEAAETNAAEQLARAERAEYREQAHQDYWAVEVDRLRQKVAAHAGSAATLRVLQDQVIRLTAELNAARALLMRGQE